MKVRAWVHSGPGDVALRDVEATTDYPYLEVEAIGVCGTDVHLHRGRLGSRFPLVMGHEVVGVVRGAAADAFGLRDRRVVLGPSGSCMHCLTCVAGKPLECSKRSTYGLSLSPHTPSVITGGCADIVHLLPGYPIFAVPDGVPPELAILAEPMACVQSALRRLAASGQAHGGTLAVIGAGPTGLLAALCAPAFGLRATVVDRQEARLRAASDMGLRAVHSSDVGKRSFGFAIDCAGTGGAISLAIELLQPRGALSIFGCFTDVGTVPLAPFDVCTQELSILGAATTDPTEIPIALAQLAERTPAFAKVVSETDDLFGRDALPNALSKMEQQQCGKICLRAHR